MAIDMSDQEIGGRRRQGRARRKTVTESWVYEVTVGDDGATLTLRCSEPAVEDESGLHRTFWLTEGGNLVVGAETRYQLIEGAESAVTPDTAG